MSLVEYSIPCYPRSFAQSSVTIKSYRSVESKANVISEKEKRREKKEDKYGKLKEEINACL